MGELKSTLHEIAGSVRSLSEKYPNDPDPQEMLKLLGMQ